jgi:hypothetical protein
MTGVDRNRDYESTRRGGKQKMASHFFRNIDRGRGNSWYDQLINNTIERIGNVVILNNKPM